MSTDVLVVGGSVAAVRAAEAIARHAPDLAITVLSDEEHPPYERPPLSKVGLRDDLDLAALTYPSVADLRGRGVEFRLGTRATALDVGGRSVEVVDGSGRASEIEYGAVVVTTGCEPIVPPLFRDLPDVYSLRRFQDAAALRHAVSDRTRSVAVIGAGFIGGEFAATLAKDGRAVTIVDLAEKPLGRFGDRVAADYAALHRDSGVGLQLGDGVVGFENTAEGRVLRLGSGATVPADVVLLGIGVRPSTEWLASSGVVLNNGIECDAHLRAADRVYAAGDVVRWPNARFGSTMRIEHWTNAAEQGRIAGINAANSVTGADPVVCATVPYFWSDQHGTRIQFSGFLSGDEEIVESPGQDGSLYVYRSGDVVAGVLAFERRAEFVKIRALLRRETSWETVQSMLPLASSPVA
ncbi:NAD(P)/FAD-dependent oxidoreductase [Rhodococcus sp. BP-149]|uniref:NAD(P)/FAD-dependent oxidoreductase n=1 Tax=unclassified Rhodococcus (in: high G+C Gram-positive bacteria) TaxID=192944 RepID=UPI001C9ABF14|nr:MULTISPECIES: FAD/NAD(P)-binding oxidoreductase [unclassified Rhodococcus (in: high G+C Gram-positive bacteria)]MBY6685609.1 NAD(P)/FAD-dependent oxidoreductase [Rhodococcus sp. BP-288]MBY6694843.1 NAD(P)/FAD-dependent oxidoreductase [Rhodococcus sp. BP-188]MBY6696689.1 NAD(P)/FAD-dependent oxidoreductase [Rhodococcus sp. BP-285]MBY6703345.1 NAD(P)/FAD-dependent oxidoreductase [Rhodococcus sp. BP-283]MBY6710701.1 NAD(P)/FAD-dependent oxidoreductase [Rhodococcus sp. BP-160]